MAPKYQFIADSLRSEIENGQYSSKQLLPTEQLLCQRFQISRQTIRRALSVLEEEGLITRRQGSGSHLRERTEETAPLNCTVAVVTTYINDYIFPNILQGMESVLTANSSAPLLFATQNQISTERKILQTLLTMKPLDGVLVEGSKTALPCPNLDLYRKLLDRGVRLVFINGCYPELSAIPSVLADNYGGGRMLVEYLAQKGHQHIAGIFKNDDMQGTLRYSGYMEAIRDLGLPFEDEQVLWYNTEGRKSFRSEAFVDSALEGFRDCSAIVCYNDEVAIRVVSQLKKRGTRIPEEMAVVSFDNSPYSELSPVRITSLSHGLQNLGELSASLMLRLLRGEAHQSEVVPWQLVEKESG
ncbi:Arabinose metabolism transcriptional repressor [Firmicutes bacterium ASF500]|nr:Arabinose metabolism transcriptional repressor [Firmicutes bacterium ASF500]